MVIPLTPTRGGEESPQNLEPSEPDGSIAFKAIALDRYAISPLCMRR